MSKNTDVIPFTEILERVISLGRVSANAHEKVRGIINDVYLREIPVKYDWNFLMVSSAITTTEEYKTGTVSINTGSQSASFSSDATMTAAMVGLKIKFINNDVVYDINSFAGAQALQILPPLQGATNLSSTTYSIFQPIYALAKDFDRFPKDGGLYKWEGGAKKRLAEESYQEYTDDYRSTPSNSENVRLVGMDTAGNQLIEFTPPPSKARVYGYDYIKRLRPLIENTAGLIKGISSGATDVAGMVTNTRFLDSTTGDWFRFSDFGKASDSSWYQTIAITSNSDLTLSTAFANTAVTSSGNFAISRAPEIPPKLHPAILFQSLAHILADQNDPNAAVYMQKAALVVSDAKRIYVSRTYSTEFRSIAEEYQYRR